MCLRPKPYDPGFLVYIQIFHVYFSTSKKINITYKCNMICKI